MRRSSSEYGVCRTMRKQTKRMLGAIDRLLWPPRSLITGEHLPGPGLIEPENWRALEFLSAPLCVRCGAPFEIDLGPDQSCAACIARPPVFDRARAALAYNDMSRNIVLRFKHGSDRSGLALMARWMVQAMPELVDSADLIIPTPLHYRRLLSRGFNQSLVLAAALSRNSGTPLAHHALKRVRATPSQAGLSAGGRKRNVRGAFVVSARGVKRVRGKRILLVDDVFTTGATAEACTRALRKAGAAHVDVATLARVVSPTDPTI